MNGKVKANLRIMEDGITKVLSINGHIVPNMYRVIYTEGVNEIPRLTVEIEDVEYQVIDMHAAASEAQRTRALVEEAFEDGRIIEAYYLREPEVGWYETCKAMGTAALDWNEFNYRLVRRTK